MITKKLIIENRALVTDEELLEILQSKVNQGRISETKRGKQFCFATIMTVNCNLPREYRRKVAVYADRTKAGTDTIKICNYVKPESKPEIDNKS